MQPDQKVGGARFTLVKPLGRGGMGEVWLAYDERLQEQVALKFLPLEIRGDPVALDDLRRETVRSHKLSHPNIVRIYDLHEDPDGTVFIIMEYIDGPTLANLRLQEPSGALAWDYLRPLVEQLCAALDFAHGEKIIHRNLKPANMMVDGRGRLKLADFGIAARGIASIGGEPVKNAIIGTLSYRSPQQVRGEPPQVTDDIYALGATLYELLTSKPPFHSGDITYQVLHEPPEPMEDRLAALEIHQSVPADVAALVMAALAKDAGQRPQSARAMVEWIGLEAATNPFTESLAPESAAQEAPRPELLAGEERGHDRPKPAVWRRSLAVVGIVVLVLAVAFWRRFAGPHGDHANTPVAARDSAQTELEGESKAAATTDEARSAVAPNAQTSDRSAIAAVKLNQDEAWTFTTIAGQAGSSGSKDGVGSEARFTGLYGIAVDKEGNIYVTESRNNTIRLIKPSGIVSTLAGLARMAGSSDGLKAAARFHDPHGIAVDRTGNAYVADSGNNTIRKIAPSGMVTTFAGWAGIAGSADGPAATARFHDPVSIAVGPEGNIFVVDRSNLTIRKITPGGVVSTVAGQAGVEGTLDGQGPSARFKSPDGLVVGAQGFVYVSGETIRVITPSGEVSTWAGKEEVPSPAHGFTTKLHFRSCYGIASDGEGNLYITDTDDHTIRTIARSGEVATIGGLDRNAGSNDGTGADARFNRPIGIALDDHGDIYVCERVNGTIRKGHRQQAVSRKSALPAATASTGARASLPGQR